MSALRAVASAAVYTGIYCCIYTAWRTINEHDRSLKNLEKRVTDIELTHTRWTAGVGTTRPQLHADDFIRR
jgi:hypothetical protein